MKQQKPPVVVIIKKGKEKPKPNLSPKIKVIPPRYAEGLPPSITAKSSQYANSWRLN